MHRCDNQINRRPLLTFLIFLANKKKKDRNSGFCPTHRIGQFQGLRWSKMLTDWFHLLKWSSIVCTHPVWFRSVGHTPNLIWQKKLSTKSHDFYASTFPFFLFSVACFLPYTRDAKSGVKQFIHSLSVCLSVCLSVHKSQFMIEEQLNINFILYFEHYSNHESENKLVV